MRNRPPQYWLRLLIPFLFFFGGAGMIFWAQGFRFDFSGGRIVATGVVSVSTRPPGSLVFFEGAYKGTTPGVFLGIPLGELPFCIAQSDFMPYCSVETVGHTRVTEIKNIQMLPEVPVARIAGTLDQYFWDPQGRGYIRFFPQLSYVFIGGQNHPKILEDVGENPELFLSPSGRLVIISNGAIQTYPVFKGGDIAPDARLLPDGRGIMYIAGHDLLLRDPRESESRKLAHFEREIERAFFLPDSESILVFLPDEIRFLFRPGAPAVRLFSKDADFQARFYPQERSLFFKQNGQIMSYVFSN